MVTNPPQRLCWPVAVPVAGTVFEGIFLLFKVITTLPVDNYCTRVAMSLAFTLGRHADFQ